VSVLLAGAAVALSACANDTAGTKPAAPVTVSRAVAESELSSITLTPEAESRLGLVVEPLTERPVRLTRIVAGEVVVPPGDAVDLTAPVAGTLVAAGDHPPRPGSPVRRGQALLRLVPLLPADRAIRIDAEREVATTRAALEASESELARTEQLLGDGSASQRRVEEARLARDTARAAARAAAERLSLVERNPVGESGELVIAAPLDGLVEVVRAAPGQTVAANATLLRIVRLSRLWVRVPVYAGDARDVDPASDAVVLGLDEPADAPGTPARPVAAPPTADPTAATIDLVYELPAGAHRRPGERVLVRLAGRAQDAAPVVPDGALLHDIHGGAWVYEQVEPHVFVRRRVDVRDTTNGLAVLARGPAAGALIVTVGAAELYGVEFGAGK
jgi:RND family efflux transporter MFP subunit